MLHPGRFDTCGGTPPGCTDACSDSLAEKESGDENTSRKRTIDEALELQEEAAVATASFVGKVPQFLQQYVAQSPMEPVNVLTSTAWPLRRFLMGTKKVRIFMTYLPHRAFIRSLRMPLSFHICFCEQSEVMSTDLAQAQGSDSGDDVDDADDAGAIAGDHEVSENALLQERYHFTASPPIGDDTACSQDMVVSGDEGLGAPLSAQMMRLSSEGFWSLDHCKPLRSVAELTTFSDAVRRGARE